jgi:hypothetical protein
MWAPSPGGHVQGVHLDAAVSWGVWLEAVDSQELLDENTLPS